MNLLSVFWHLGARASRRQFWLGALLVTVLWVVASIVLLLAGLGVSSNFSTTFTPDHGAPSTATGTTFALSPWGVLLSSLITVYPSLAIGIKRRHDRGGSGWDVAGVAALRIVVNLMAALGMSGAAGLLNILLFVCSIYLLVVLGILKGTAGPNAYGPDPLVS